MARNDKNMNYIRKLEIVIRNEMQKHNKIKIQRFNLNMKYLISFPEFLQRQSEGFAPKGGTAT